RDAAQPARARVEGDRGAHRPLAGRGAHALDAGARARRQDPEGAHALSESAMGTSNVGVILDSYLRALEEGRAPPREELLARHPQCAAELAAALDGLEFIHKATREIPRGPKEGGELAERQLLGDFRLVREVGRGGMAVVYEAEQVSLGRRVALKVLPFAAVLDKKQLQRFKNEALAAAHLHHAHIVP